MNGGVQRRVVSKDGHNNIRIDNVEGMVKLYLHDIWTTVVDMKWRYKLTLFVSTFLTTWFFFGLLFYLIAMANNDLNIEQASNHTPCVMNVATLTGAYLFSLESQTTIGYGFRHISEECPLAILTLVLQLVLTGLAEIFVTGAFLAKLARPKKRAETVKFSQLALVSKHKGQLCVMVRVANMRKSPLVQCQLSGKLLSSYVTEEGEKIQLHQESVDFQLDSNKQCPFLVLPLIFYHVLDESSPLASLTAENLKVSNFELVVTLNATMESTASTCQSRTSYVPQEFRWGYEFKPLLFGTHGGKYVTDFKYFDEIQISNDTSLLREPRNEKLLLEDEYRKDCTEGESTDKKDIGLSFPKALQHKDLC
ncbi:ATP-sensitive inward rectifier potassium channel 15 [Pangasianodon hypophthalmus]|uniref:ATP-sensitive inward rectifier potassium channel 15 n=1 Tax=Pangasianodon hypophthalmus TaxID=310915 RepID=UPI000EFE936A|nr:ATP-sensitive inward rectifier potassium channel 15 [Pangasianodon hypophthalmus]